MHSLSRLAKPALQATQTQARVLNYAVKSSLRAFSSGADDASGEQAGQAVVEETAAQVYARPEPDVPLYKSYKTHVVKNTAPGKPGKSKLETRYEKDPLYSLFKQLSESDKLAQDHLRTSKLPGTPNVQSIWHKQYYRDEQGNVTTPERFKNLDLEGLDKALQKADHYFFANNVPPHIMAWDDEGFQDTHTNRSEFAAADEGEDRFMDENEADFDDNLTEDLAKVLRDDLMIKDADAAAQQLAENEYARLKMEKETGKYTIDSWNEHKYEDLDVLTLERLRLGPETENHYNEHSATKYDIEPGVEELTTARERRAEFWAKFHSKFDFAMLADQGTCRVTRATGRVMSNYACVILGNRQGTFAFGRGRGDNPETALRRAYYACPKNMLYVPLHEKRTLFQPVVAKFKKTIVIAKPQPREFGLYCPPHFTDLLESMGLEDGTFKILGSRQRWNTYLALFEVFKAQVSYRELAMRRGVHVDTLYDPQVKLPPKPSRTELAQLERDATAAFKKAVHATIQNKRLLETETFRALRPHVELRDSFHMRWNKHLDAKKVPLAMRRYPPFSEFMDATMHLMHNRHTGTLDDAEQYPGLSQTLQEEEDEDFEPDALDTQNEAGVLRDMQSSLL